MKLDLSKFECQKCQVCCRQTGYVRLVRDEADKIANFLNMDVNEFIYHYTVLTDDRYGLSLKENKDSSCIFLNPQKGCMIQKVKPVQCLEFPFKWRFKNWNKVCQWAIIETLKIRNK